MPQVTQPTRQREASRDPCMWVLASLGLGHDACTWHGWGGCQDPRGPEHTAAGEGCSPPHRVRAGPAGLYVGQGSARKRQKPKAGASNPLWNGRSVS